MSKLAEEVEKEKTLKSAMQVYKKNPDFLLWIRTLRGNFTLRECVKRIKAKHPDANVSKTNMKAWKDRFPSLVKDTDNYEAFLELVWVTKKELRNDTREWVFTANQRRDQAEKDKALRQEMDKAMIILSDLNEDNLPNTDKWKLLSSWRRQLDRINAEIKEWALPIDWWVKELYEINTKILAKTKTIILENLGTLKVKQFQDLKALSDIAETAFKQQRLIQWESTENIAIWMNEIYDKIIDTSDKQKIINIKK